MKPEAQRIAIATACGWKHHDFRFEPCSSGGLYICGRCDRSYCSPPWDKELLNGEWCDVEVHGVRVPNYLSDLNAMDEARTVLTPQQKADFVFILQCEVLGMPLPENEALWFASIHATAAQRAEAFLRTIGKWVE